METPILHLQTATLSLEELLEILKAHQEIVLMQGATPIARIAAIAEEVISTPPQHERIAGLHQGQGWISDDFTDPLPDEFWLGEDMEEDK